MTQSAQAESQIEYSWTVKPAVAERGTPTINVHCNASTVALHAQVVTLGESSQRKLAEVTTRPGEALKLALPAVEADTYVSVRVSRADAPEDEEPAVIWNTLRRPKGVPMMTYKGRPGELEPPADFDAYWQRAREELAEVPLKPKLTQVEYEGDGDCELYRVELPTVRDTKVVAWYTVPRGALEGKKQYPAMIVMPGYGAEEPPLDRTGDGIITLSLNPRHHGPSKEFWTSPVEHMNYNIENHEEQYYKLAVLDCLRGTDFLFSRPEVDKTRVAAEGGSQGGYFAIAVAALEPRISCAASNVTALANMADGMILNKFGHSQGFKTLLDEASPEAAVAIRRSMSYMDGANLASRVKSPVQINMGGRDPVCHYVSGIVVYNRLPNGIEKEYHVIPNAVHEVPDPMRENNAKWVARWWGLRETPSFPGAVLAVK